MANLAFQQLAAILKTTPQHLVDTISALRENGLRCHLMAEKGKGKTWTWALQENPSTSTTGIIISKWSFRSSPFQVSIFSPPVSVRLASSPGREGWNLDELGVVLLGLITMWPISRSQLGKTHGCAHLFHTPDCRHKSGSRLNLRQWRAQFKQE